MPLITCPVCQHTFNEMGKAFLCPICHTHLSNPFGTHVPYKPPLLKESHAHDPQAPSDPRAPSDPHVPSDPRDARIVEDERRRIWLSILSGSYTAPRAIAGCQPLTRVPRMKAPIRRENAIFDPRLPDLQVGLANPQEILDLALTPRSASGMPEALFRSMAQPRNLYLRFVIEGKLGDAGAGYFLEEDTTITRLFASLYYGLTFAGLEATHVLDIGTTPERREAVSGTPSFYSVLDPAPSPYGTRFETCLKGNITSVATPCLSIQLGDIGVGGELWRRAVSSPHGGWGALGGAAPYDPYLIAITELLSTIVLEAINSMD